MTHGCLADRQHEACANVYRDRILRGGEFYSTKKLGAIGADLGAVASFFEEPWRRLSPNLSEAAQAWLLNAAAFRLRALGRLTEARDPMKISQEMCVRMEDWKEAAIRASNVSELEVTLGLLDDAVADGRLAVDYADRSEDAFLKMGFRTTLADALFQRGDRETERASDGENGGNAEADASVPALRLPASPALPPFQEAERLQAEDQPQYPLLYSLQGFRYADLILAPAEQAAGRSSPACLTRSRRRRRFRDLPRNAVPTPSPAASGQTKTPAPAAGR